MSFVMSRIRRGPCLEVDAVKGRAERNARRKNLDGSCVDHFAYSMPVQSLFYKV